MSMSDPLADMLTRIRNAGMIKLESVDMPFSNLKLGIANILKNEGYIKDIHQINDDKQNILRIELKYDQKNNRLITGLRRISKPGRRLYVKHDKIPRVMSGLGIAIISTSKGIMTDRDARKTKLGGEFLCEVW